MTADDEIAHLNGELNKAYAAHEEAVKVLMERGQQRDNALRRLERLAAFTRWIIGNRACVCNAPAHRCGTNLMLDDLDEILLVHDGDKCICLGAMPGATMRLSVVCPVCDKPEKKAQ